MTKQNWKKQLEEEFDIHFNNSGVEFEFLVAFIDDLLKAEREELIKKIEKMKAKNPWDYKEALEDVLTLITKQ